MDRPDVTDWGYAPGSLGEIACGSETVAVREGFPLRAWAGPGGSATESNELTVDRGSTANMMPSTRLHVDAISALVTLTVDSGGPPLRALWKSIGETPTITELDAYKPIVTELPLEGRIIAGADPTQGRPA